MPQNPLAILLPNHWTHPHIVPGNNKSCTCFRTAFEIRCRPSKRPAPSSPGIDLGTAQSVGTMGPVVGRIVGSQYVLQFNVFSPPAHLKSTKSEHILLVRFSCDSVIYSYCIYVYIYIYTIHILSHNCVMFPLKSQRLFSPLGTFFGGELYIHCAFCHHQAIFVGKGLLGGIVLQLPNALALGELFLRFFRSEKKNSFPKKLTWRSLENNHHAFFKGDTSILKGWIVPIAMFSFLFGCL